MGGTNPYIEKAEVELPTKSYTITFKPVGTNGGRFVVFDGGKSCSISALESACVYSRDSRYAGNAP